MRRPPAIALAAMLVAAVAFHAYRQGGARPLAWRSISLGRVEIPGPIAKRFADAGALDRFLVKSQGFGGPRLGPGGELLLLSAGPRSSTGYGLRVESVVEQRDHVTVIVREIAPRLGDPVRPVVTYPYRLLELPSDKPIHVNWQGR